jgi:hypothetical protein
MTPNTVSVVFVVFCHVHAIMHAPRRTRCQIHHLSKGADRSWILISELLVPQVKQEVDARQGMLCPVRVVTSGVAGRNSVPIPYF